MFYIMLMSVLYGSGVVRDKQSTFSVQDDCLFFNIILHLYSSTSSYPGGITNEQCKWMYKFYWSLQPIFYKNFWKRNLKCRHLGLSIYVNLIPYWREFHRCSLCVNLNLRNKVRYTFIKVTDRVLSWPPYLMKETYHLY